MTYKVVRKVSRSSSIANPPFPRSDLSMDSPWPLPLLLQLHPFNMHQAFKDCRAKRSLLFMGEIQVGEKHVSLGLAPCVVPKASDGTPQAGFQVGVGSVSALRKDVPLLVLEYIPTRPEQRGGILVVSAQLYVPLCVDPLIPDIHPLGERRHARADVPRGCPSHSVAQRGELARGELPTDDALYFLRANSSPMDQGHFLPPGRRVSLRAGRSCRACALCNGAWV